MGWTKWRKIADSKYFYDEEFDYDGATCYEIAIAGSRGGNVRIVYVGETGNEKRRLKEYAKHGSHLSKKINQAVRKGWCIFYRAQAKNSKKEAITMQNNLLDNFEYEWNKQRNT